MKRLMALLVGLATVFMLGLPVEAAPQEDAIPELAEEFDTDAQLDALGRDELMEAVPEEARMLMEEAGVYDLSVGVLLGLTPRQLFRVVWSLAVSKAKEPIRTLGAMVGIMLLCTLLNGIKSVSDGSAMSQVLGMASVLCIVLSVARPILDCIMDTAKAIQDASLFMVSFVPVFSAAMVASGQPATGATYNMLLFGACQAVSQIVSQTLVPLLCIYLAFCIVGAMWPELNMASTAGMVKTTVTWTLGFVFTLFVALLSLQTMVSTGADSATTKAAKFLLGSFVPVVGGVLSDAFLAAQGCLKLIKTSVGAYGLVVAVFTFLPVLLKTCIWYVITNISVVAGDLMGASNVTAVLKSCSTVLGILLAIILCYGLLLIVSTTVVMVTGMGAG